MAAPPILERRWLLETRAKTVKNAAARAPIDFDPLGEFDSEPVETPQRQEGPRRVAKAPPPVEPARRRVEWGPVVALALAMIQIPVVALWLAGVPSPLVLSAGATAPSPPRTTVSAPVTPSALPDVRPMPKVVDEVAPDPGVLHVETQPARLRVTIDGTFRGRSPLTLTDLTTGSHSVVVRFGTQAIERIVDVQPGKSLSLVLAGPADVSATGAVTVDAAIPLQVYRDDQIVGSSETGALILPVGEHTLDIRDDRLGFRVQQAVRVRAGTTTPVRIELPRAPIFVDAQPSAEVWIDGTPVGMTPLNALMWTIGRHQVRVRHPELGERSATVLVTLDEPARLSIDLRN